MQAPFYPTVTDKISTMGMAFTAELQSIPVTEPDFTSSYYLGWMRWENLPLQYHVSRSTFEDGILTFTDVTKPENVPVGFSIHNDNNIDIYKWAYSGVKYNGTKWVNIDYAYSSNASRYFYLPNNLDINVLSWGRIRLIFLAMSEDRTITLQAITADVPYADFAAGNNMTAVINDSGPLRNQTFTVTKDDISSHAIFQKEINGTVFDIVLAAYTIPYNRDCRFNNGVDDYAAVHPMVKIHTIDNIPYVSGVTNPVQFQFVDDCRWGSGYFGQGFQSNWSGAVNSLTAFNNSGVYDWCGGFVGSFQVSDLTPGSVNLIVPNGATFYVRGVGRSDFFIIGRVLTYDEILHCMSLIPRMQESGINRYEQNNTYWYGHVDFETNEFLGDLVNGSQLNKLVDWQLLNHNIADNEFKEEEIPEYEPGSGEDWDGDRILPPVISGIGDLNGFITMYGMKPSQVAALGNYLWAKFTDATFWESISAVLDNTASIDPSVILNYVVSIRAYPFDLSDVAGTTNEFPLVYFGRGLIGIPVEASPVSQSLRVLHKCVDTFAGGDLSVPAKYGDFRDMEPCAKLLLHVPFCGSCEINPSQVVGKHLFLRYTIDFATGGMMAICYTSDSAGEMAYPVAELHGHVGASVQLTASNELDALQSLAGIGSGLASMMVGNPEGIAGVIGAASSLATNRAVPHSTGKASGFAAYFQPRVPYIEIVYDQYYKPSNYAHVHGNACQVVKKIGSLHGYTICKNVDTSGLTCEGDERIMIKRIMESGFYVD